MAKNPGKTDRSINTLGFNPDVYAGALAHIIKVETTDQGRRETVLGQAWLAGVGKLVTCGHVVEPHMKQPGSLIVTFPYSGNRYPINEIKLHPSFVRQPDGLVKFDAALLLVQLNEPELSARILPIVYEKALPSQLGLTAVRYPVHLGQYSSALNPLAQSGRLLGPLRKHDDFHLLHDTALAPGDSGAPIFDNETLVALHCGDTATLPGLNLPTTSIRLALWVDSLRELGIEGVMATTGAKSGMQLSPATLVAAFWLVFLLAMGGVSAYKAYPSLAKHTGEGSKVKPVMVTMDKPADKYAYGDNMTLSLSSQSKCYVYLYAESGPNSFLRIFPNLKMGVPPNENMYTLAPGASRTVDFVGDASLSVDCNPMKFHLFALNNELKPLDIGASYQQAAVGKGMMLNTTKEVQSARDLQAKYPNQVIEVVFDSPIASKESFEKYKKQHSQQGGDAPVQNQAPTTTPAPAPSQTAPQGQTQATAPDQAASNKTQVASP